jgi:hypothetical protein
MTFQKTEFGVEKEKNGLKNGGRTGGRVPVSQKNEVSNNQ